MSASTIVLITLIAYKVVLLGVGFWASKRVKSESDFFLGGQGLGAWTAGLSYAASTSSAWVLLGFTGLVYSQGVVGLWLVPGIFGGYLLTWLVMGPRLNAETAERGYITVIDFLTGDLEAKWVSIIGKVAALMILFCFVFYISSQFQAAGNALVEVFEMSAAKAIIVGAVIIVIYCLLGGFWAASITDALQAVVMMLACVIVPIAAVTAAGGMGAIIDTLHTSQPQSYFSFTGNAAGMAGIGVAMGLFGTGLGALGQPQLLNRIMAVKSDAERKKGAAITIVWGIVIYSGLVCLAFAGRASNIDTGGESLFFAAAEQYLPPVLAGVVIAAVLSAVMSTVDSLLLAAASAVSHDMGIKYPNSRRTFQLGRVSIAILAAVMFAIVLFLDVFSGWWRYIALGAIIAGATLCRLMLKYSSYKADLLFGRIAMVGIAIFAVLMTLYMPKDIFSRVLFSWVALGAAFGPTILTKCLGWRVNGGFVLAAVLVGFFTAVIFSNVDGPSADVIEKWVSWVIGLVILFVGRKT